MDPWEALDLDDSDLCSPLRRCKRRHISPEPYKDPTAAAVPPPIPFPESGFPPSQPKTLDLPPPPQSAAVPKATETVPRLIPGPAGILQAAMYRKAQNDRIGFMDGGDPIPTQEYIRRAVEDGAGEDDEEFSRDPWLCAVDFIRRGGLLDGVAIGTPIRSIKTCPNFDRVAQVVAVIKSCTPNGLGDLMVTLKDPTGSIGASVHHKVFVEKEFGRDICVGSVIILQKVAVFSPSRTAHYLNITRDNVVKVFSEDAPLLEQDNSAITFERGAAERSEQTCMPGKEFFPLQGRTGRVGDSVRRTAVDQTENVDEAKGSSSCSNRSSRNVNAAADMQSILARLGGSRGITEAAVDTSSVSNQQTDVDGSGNDAGGRNQSGGIFCSSTLANSAMLTNDGDVGNRNGGEKQRQLPCSRGLMPEWTDEQLDALSVFDCDDDNLF